MSLTKNVGYVLCVFCMISGISWHFMAAFNSTLISTKKLLQRLNVTSVEAQPAQEDDPIEYKALQCPAGMPAIADFHLCKNVARLSTKTKDLNLNAVHLKQSKQPGKTTASIMNHLMLLLEMTKGQSICRKSKQCHIQFH